MICVLLINVINVFFGVITVRNEVAKVMFLQVSVCPQEGYLTRYPRTRYTAPPGPGSPPGTRYTPRDQVHSQDQVHPREQVHPPGPGTPCQDQVHPPRTRYTPLTRYSPPPRYGHCCGRYTSYWNAFLLNDQYMWYNVQRIIDYSFLITNLSFRLQI